MVRTLIHKYGAAVTPLKHDDCDLLDLRQAHDLFYQTTYDFVFHCAGVNGGLAKNLAEPASILFHNTVMALHLLEACRGRGELKFVGMVASCAYGDNIDGIMREREFFNGLPHESVLGHGMAKRNLQMGCRLYAKQYGLRAICVCPTTLIGPGDSFDLARTKVGGALVKRFVDAADDHLPEVVMPGSGVSYREFLYVEDAADLIAKAAVLYDNSEYPLNLGSGEELTIFALAELVAHKAGYRGRIAWSNDGRDGQRRKRLDTGEMRRRGVMTNFTPIDVAVERTIADYRRRKAEGKI